MADMPTSATSFTVVIQPAGWTFTASADMPVMQAAREAGFVLPSSCRNGTCRTCMCRLRSGKVEYRIEWPGLAAEEKAEGWILPCVAHAATALVIDAPAARLQTTEPPKYKPRW
jgi:ferredoxin